MKFYGAIILALFVACSALAADNSAQTSPIVLAGSFLDCLTGTTKGGSPAENNKEAGEAFLASNKNNKDVITLPSGLQYRIIKQGDGPKPTAFDTVVVHYRGTLINGTEFDSSFRRNKPSTFQVNGVIAGWTEALQLMPVGSTWELFIPPTLAYGKAGAGSIGPNEVLIFQVELLSIK